MLQNWPDLGSSRQRNLQKIFKEIQDPLELGLKHDIGSEAKHPAKALITASLVEKTQMLNANDIALVRATFARVVPIQSAAADLFYDRLFGVSPKLRELFPADLRGQKQKLMQMIATAVGGLNNLNQLVPAVKALGARHSSYGVTTEHYRLVGEALLWTLERGLGQDFTPEVRSAWAKVYHVLAATMQAGAAQVANVQAAE
jgi:hemoglobin-like flavoprotein